MGKEQIRNLLLQVGSLLKSYDKIAKATGENFNIFTVMGMESNEVKTHSAIIGELLNPEGSHGFDDMFLMIFINQINIGLKLETKNSKSKIEESIGRINNDLTEGGRVDILVYDNENNAFVIENKIYAGEQINQIGRYNKAFPNAPILFLTLFGDKPKSSGELVENIDYFIFSYEVHILKWLEECLKETVKHPMLREVLSHYINLIKKLTHQTLNNELKMEISELIKNNFSSAMEIANNYNNVKNLVIKEFWDKLEKNVREKLVKDNWFVRQDLKLISKYNHLLFSHNEYNNSYLYYRFNINDGTVEYGIILKEGKGSDVFKNFQASKPQLILDLKENFKTSDYQSVIWKKDDEFDFSNPEQLKEMNNESTIFENNPLKRLSNKVVKFINEKENLYNSILEHDVTQKSN